MLIKKALVLLVILFTSLIVQAQNTSIGETRTAYQDDKGVIRWSDNKKELSLYGANYCLPSACDYRAAGYVTKDRKKLVDQDMAHFARMGFDALRLSFWGDFENTDKYANLLQNEHLDLMDYVIYKAKERGVYMLLSPIVTYNSLWPDANQDTMSIKGSISATFKKSELGTNPQAGIHISPADWNYYGSENWHGRILPATGPIKLLQPEKDADKMAFTRIGDGIRSGIFKMIAASNTGDDAFHLELPLSYDRNLDDYTVSVSVKDKIADCGEVLKDAKSLMLNARGISQKQDAFITLVENDGTSWSKKIPLKEAWENINIPLNDLQIGKGVKLPLGYPGRWDYWFTPAAGRGNAGDHVNLQKVEWLQISIRQSASTVNANAGSYIDLSSVELGFENQ